MLERWLSRSKGKAIELVHSADITDAAAPSVASQRLQLRQILFDDIKAFLDTHNLELTGVNFEFARDCGTGHDPALAAAVQQHLADALPLTNAAVQEILAQHRPSQFTTERLAVVLETVDSQMAALIGLNDQTQGSASDYRVALEGQLRELDAGGAASIASKLVTLTLGMVERSQAIEKEARESQKQTKKLRRDLERARHAADHDELTGLPNRRAFERRFSNEVERVRGAGGQLAVAFCDIDHFKKINDGYGHDTGDRVIKLVGNTLAAVTGNQCHVARHGGEEFVILLPGMSVEAAALMVDDARDEVSSKRLIQRDSGKHLPPVTFSAGIADAIASPSPTSALSAADKALYFAKAQGRNCISIADTGGPRVFSSEVKSPNDHENRQNR
ncbi:MAG: GGDEF domain-containing protein [Sphingopyxis sp.]